MNSKLKTIILVDTEKSNKVFNSFFLIINLFFILLSSYTYFTGNDLYLAHMQYHILVLLLAIIPLGVLNKRLEYQTTFKYIYYFTFMFYILSSAIINNQADVFYLFTLFTLNIFGIVYLSKRIYVFSTVIAVVSVFIFSNFPLLFKPNFELQSAIIYRETIVLMLSILGYLALSRILGLMEKMSESTFNPFIDKATGTYNKYYLREVIKNASGAEDKDLSIIVVDAGNMKNIISRFGFESGNLAASRMADVLKRCTRQNDSICRTEDGQFVIVAQHPKDFQVETLVQRIRSIIQNEEFIVDLAKGEEKVSLDCSLGAATLREGENSDSLLERANSELEKAKEAKKKN